MFIKKFNYKIIFGVMLIIVFAVIGCSKKSEVIIISNYFPIDKPVSYKLQGILNDIQNNQNKEIVVEFECTGKSEINGRSVYIQKRKYLDNSGNIILNSEVYFDYGKNRSILEIGRKNNDKLAWNDEPNTYLQSGKLGDIYHGIDKTVGNIDEGISNKSIIQLKGLINLTIDGELYKDCLFVEKTFYEGKNIARREQLYLQNGVGLIKYIEESFVNPYKLEVNYVKK